jgi:hypothetical protein
VIEELGNCLGRGHTLMFHREWVAAARWTDVSPSSDGTGTIKIEQVSYFEFSKTVNRLTILNQQMGFSGEDRM